MSAVGHHASSLRAHPMRLEPGTEILSTLIRYSTIFNASTHTLLLLDQHVIIVFWAWMFSAYFSKESEYFTWFLIPMQCSLNGITKQQITKQQISKQQIFCDL